MSMQCNTGPKLFFLTGLVKIVTSIAISAFPPIRSGMDSDSDGSDETMLVRRYAREYSRGAIQ